MEAVNKCRCCLAEGLHKDLNTQYVSMAVTEIYADMLSECFNIQLLSSPYISNGICDPCIGCLRAAATFRHQVLQAEENIINMVNNDGKENSLNVKIEPDEYLTDGADYDSDDFTLAQTIKLEENQTKPKKEPSGRKEEGVKVKFSKLGQKPKTPSITLNAIAVPLEMPEINEQKPRVKTEKKNKITVTINPSSNKMELKWKKPRHKTIEETVLEQMLKEESEQKTKGNSKIKLRLRSEASKSSLKWLTTRELNSDKYKRRRNLEAILKHTNATPFAKPMTVQGYKCVFCKEELSSPILLRIHYKENHKTEYEDLGQAFSKDDYCVKVDIYDLECMLCGTKFDNLSILMQHLATSHDIKLHFDVKDHIIPYKLDKLDNMYQCALCTSTYETFKTLLQHMSTHFSNYVCDVCGAAFVTLRSKQSHDRIHVGIGGECETCGKEFSTEQRLKYHMKMRHKEKAVALTHCYECQIDFANYYQRNSHMIKVHNAEARYKCNVCNRGFLLKTLLMYHVKKSHLMERNVVCPVCGKRFFNSRTLNEHMVKHTGEKNYICNVCNKAYGRRFTLREHMRIHNNDRRFKCDVCQMMFVQKCSLRSHLLSNHGISMQASEISVNVDTTDGVDEVI